jgi:kynureninase
MSAFSLPNPATTSASQLDAWVEAADRANPLAGFRDAFHLPHGPDGQPALYFAGHSLGPQPRAARQAVLAELDDWAQHGVEGHFVAKNPWMPYHEQLTAATARLVGAEPAEVVVANTLTVNVHLLLVSFYRPRPGKAKLLIEAGAFPSDRYAVASQIQWHGFDPATQLIALAPREGEHALRPDDILAAIDLHGPELATVLLGNCNYLTGQAFDMRAIAAAGHKHGALVGFDLAHGAGNLQLDLHDSGADFACWCNYKYLNAGPGHLGGLFVHARHHQRTDLPRLAGWWGHDKASRFAMGPDFVPIAGAEAWQLSNPPILPLAVLRTSMDLFDAAGIDRLRAHGDALTAWLLQWLDSLPANSHEVWTPRDPAQRGSMLTIATPKAAELVAFLAQHGALVDLRRPNIVRLTPAPLYTTFADVAALGRLMQRFFATA